MSAITAASSSAGKLIPELWTPGLLRESTEEEVVGKNFASPPGTTKIGKKLHIPKMVAIAIGNVVSSDGASGAGGVTTGLSYINDAQDEVVVEPVQTYAALEIAHSTFKRMTMDLTSPYRDCLKAALAETRDRYAAGLAAGLSVNVKGSALQSLDKGLFLDAQMALTISGKRKFKPGVTPWYIKINPLQLKNCLGIFDFTADYVTGGNGKPLVSGWMSKILNANIDESGNVLNSAGVIHNLGYIPEAFVRGFNEESTILPEQMYELVVRFIATEEFGMAEAFDEYAVDMQTGQN